MLTYNDPRLDSLRAAVAELQSQGLLGFTSVFLIGGQEVTVTVSGQTAT